MLRLAHSLFVEETTCVNVCRFLRAVSSACDEKREEKGEREVDSRRTSCCETLNNRFNVFCGDLLLLYVGISGRVERVHSFFFSLNEIKVYSMRMKMIIFVENFFRNFFHSPGG